MDTILKLIAIPLFMLYAFQRISFKSCIDNCNWSGIKHIQHIFSAQCSLYLGAPDRQSPGLGWSPGCGGGGWELRRAALQSRESLLEEWVPILCRGEIGRLNCPVI